MTKAFIRVEMSKVLEDHGRQLKLNSVKPHQTPSQETARDSKVPHHVSVYLSVYSDIHLYLERPYVHE